MGAPLVRASRRRQQGKSLPKIDPAIADSAADPPIRPNFAAIDDAASITAEEREELIRKAAYLHAESRGFSPGHELDDWLAAQSQIDQLIASGNATPSDT